jgi:hypothetical protein
MRKTMPNGPKPSPMASYPNIIESCEGKTTIMAIESMIRDIFGRFRNLNLLALIFDLDQDRTARQAWASGSLLCPVEADRAGPRLES